MSNHLQYNYFCFLLIQEYLIKLLLAPFSFLYGGVISLRNLLYKNEVLRSVKFDIPIISIGNISVGGTGKSPHVEFLLKWLKEFVPVAVLSRGYKRKSTGFIIGQEQPEVDKIGDEPYQYLTKFPDIPIAVSENREIGIPLLLKSFPETRLILLDDAFQHLSVKPFINILLTAHESLFTRDFLLPSGRLREWRSGYKRADILIVTKCPKSISSNELQSIINELKPFPHQSVFFTEYRYQLPYYLFNKEQRVQWHDELFVVLLSGIANTEYLESFITKHVKHVQLLSFADHHWYSKYDMGQLKRQYDELPGPYKIIITTEKDATRLQSHREYIIENKLPIFILPVEVHFLNNEEERFKNMISQKLLEFKV